MAEWIPILYEHTVYRAAKADCFRARKGTRPMPLCERKALPHDAGRQFEIMYDGYRLLAAIAIAPLLKDEIGWSDFDRPHKCARREGCYRGADTVAYCVFDLLFPEGKDLREQPMERRKPALPKMLAEPSPGLPYLDIVADGVWLHGHARALGLEGAAQAPRSCERSRHWVKV